MKITISKYLFILGIMFLVSCGNNHSYVFYSKDRQQCFTVISEGKIRYIINGENSSVPDSNYVKIDLRNIDSLGDEIVGCWKNEKYEWEVINDKAIILENKLDNKRFKFGTKFPEVNGIPTLKDFLAEKCFDLGFNYNELNKYHRGVIVE